MLDRLTASALVKAVVTVVSRRPMTPKLLAEDGAAHRGRDRQEREPSARSASRQQAIEDYLNQDYIGEFERQVRQALSQLADRANAAPIEPAGESGANAATVTAASEISIRLQSLAAAADALKASIDDAGEQAEPADALESHDDAPPLQSDAAQELGIDEAIDAINDAASQANVLALNATLEAARAGEAGRGFAGAASEVEWLASQTTNAADDISAQLVEMATAIAAVVEQQVVATREITQLEGAKNGADGLVGVCAAPPIQPPGETENLVGNLRTA